MSIYRSAVCGLSRVRAPTAEFSLTPVRTATKRASGSKTNKNDSAGRRLGPKSHEGHFVKPGQILMRQRGTTLHPGENTSIGKDHTIFAVEPGYVRFYYDPFHPLRKFVGVALKKDLTLPTPHFEPRVRRFGYVELTDEAEALKEESHMSRKEYLQQDELKKAELNRQARLEQITARFADQLKQLAPEFPHEDMQLAVERLVSVYGLYKSGEPLADAAVQATFNHIYTLDVEARSGRKSAAEVAEAKARYTRVAAAVDGVVAVDISGNLAPALADEAIDAKRAEIIAQLDTYADRVLSQDDRAAIQQLVATRLVFGAAERAQLLRKYIPPVVAEAVADTVVEIANAKKPPKGVKVVRRLDNTSKQLHVFGRTAAAFN